MIVCKTDQEQRVWDAAFGAMVAKLESGAGFGLAARRRAAHRAAAVADDAVVALRHLTDIYVPQPRSTTPKGQA